MQLIKHQTWVLQVLVFQVKEKKMITASPQPLTEVSTTQKLPLGTRFCPDGKNVYMYGKGVASTVAGSWVSFDDDGNTTLLAANAVGRVGIAQAALVASTYGWYQIYGKSTIAKVLAGFADNGKVYSTSTAGSVDDAVVSGDLIVGAIGRSAISGGVADMELNFPFATDVLG